MVKQKMKQSMLIQLAAVTDLRTGYNNGHMKYTKDSVQTYTLQSCQNKVGMLLIVVNADCADLLCMHSFVHDIVQYAHATIDIAISPNRYNHYNTSPMGPKWVTGFPNPEFTSLE